jgi:hypothetical protein
MLKANLRVCGSSLTKGEKTMSDKMFERISVSEPLREFNRQVSRMNDEDRKNLELEYERITGIECDDAAQAQSDSDFVESMRKAYESMMKKKRDASRSDNKAEEIYA